MPGGLPEQKYMQNKAEDLDHWQVYGWREVFS